MDKQILYQIKINKYNYIIEYSFVGDICGIIVDFEIEKNPLEYQYINGKFIYNPIPEKPLGVALEYDGTSWIETATLEQQIEYYKNIIIEKTREHKLLKVSGFTGTKEEINLQTEIENLKQIYMDKNHELALQIDNKLRGV
ncbi:MAG: hypothetical protein ACRDAS_04780 [Cetobacterium sp.]